MDDDFTKGEQQGAAFAEKLEHYGARVLGAEVGFLGRVGRSALRALTGTPEITDEKRPAEKVRRRRVKTPTLDV
jgi:hypothetical protein